MLGAKTSSFSSEGNFKPGIDFYNSGGKEGQALMLQHFAASHNVRLIALSIGGNNFNFAGIVQTCVEDWLLSPSWWPDYCSSESSVTSNFSSGNVATQKAAIKGAIQNIATAMSAAGYSSSQYTIVVQDYPSPIPNGSGFRYSQSGYTRQTVGGCGFWNTDANYANSTMLPTINGAVLGAAAASGLPNVTTMDLSAALNGHRLCEKGVGLLEEEGLSSWTAPEAVNKSEWVNQIRTSRRSSRRTRSRKTCTRTTGRSSHLRNCLTQAYNAGSPRGGTCTISGAGVNSAGEPNMSLH